MSMLLLVTLLSVAPAESGQSAEAVAPREAEPTLWAVGVKMGATPAFFSLTQGFGWGGYGAPGLMSGLFVERGLGKHVTLELGASVYGSNQVSPVELSSVSFGVAPALRWYPGRAFDGGWVGVVVPLGWSFSRSTSLNPDGAQQEFNTQSASVGAELLLGWTFRWGNRFMASLAAGPTLALATSRMAGGGLSSPPFFQGAVGVRGLLSAGIAL